MKQGDTVFIPLYVAGIHDDTAILAGNHKAAEAGHGNYMTIIQEVLPWHPALPALARWLSQMPEGTTEHLQEAIEQYFRGNAFTRDVPTTRKLQAMRSLLTALNIT